MKPLVLCISQQNSVLLSIKQNEQNRKKNVRKKKIRGGEDQKKNNKRHASLFLKHEQLNKDYSSVAPMASVQGGRVQKSQVALSIVPFHTSLKLQKHIQVTEGRRKKSWK